MTDRFKIGAQLPGAPAEHTPEEDDETWVIRAQAAPTEFVRLYQRYVRTVYGYCHQRLGDHHLAEDATSITFMKALAALPRYRAQSFRAWLFTIAHNVVTDVHRRRPVVPLDDDPEFEDTARTVEEDVLMDESNQRVRCLLTFLTPRERDVVELRLAGLSTAEIAAVVGRRPGAVRIAEFRAHQRLRAILSDQGDPS